MVSGRRSGRATSETARRPMAIGKTSSWFAWHWGHVVATSNLHWTALVAAGGKAICESLLLLTRCRTALQVVFDVVGFLLNLVLIALDLRLVVPDAVLMLSN